MCRRVGQELGGNAGVAGPGEIAHGDRGDDDRAAVGAQEMVGMVQHTVEHGTPDRPGAEHRDTQRRTAHRTDA